MTDRDQTSDDAEQSTPPVDGPGSTGDDDDAGAMSQDQPGGSEHGTDE